MCRSMNKESEVTDMRLRWTKKQWMEGPWRPVPEAPEMVRVVEATG